MDERVPKNLQGLLRFAMDATKAEDAPNSSRLDPMDEERKKFLEEVLQSLSVDVAEELQKALQTLHSDSSTEEEKIESMELLREFVDNIDHANCFVKLGGAEVLISLLEANNMTIKKLATKLIADLCQNNPFCQSRFGNEKVFTILINMLNDELASSEAMHAISCIVRHYEKALFSFAEIGGLESLAASLTSNRENMVIKCCFLISSIASEFPHIRDQLVNMGVIQALASSLKGEMGCTIKHESILSALVTFMHCDEGKNNLRAINLEPTLTKLIELSAGQPEFQEIQEYSNTLLPLFQATKQNQLDR